MLLKLKALYLQIILFSRWFTFWVKGLIAALSDNLLALIVILVSYCLLWEFGQTQDLLLVLNQKEFASNLTEVPLFFFSLFIIATLIWQAPKYLKPHNYQIVNLKNFLFFIPDSYVSIPKVRTLKTVTQRHIKDALPRILGTIFILVYAFGILNAMSDIGIYKYQYWVFSPGIAFVLSVTILSLLLIKRFYSAVKSFFLFNLFRGTIIIFLLMLFFGLIFYLGLKNSQDQGDLFLLFISTVLLAMFFLVFSLTRWEFLATSFMNKAFYRFFVFGVFLCFSVFIGINLFIEYARYVNPISVFLFGLTFYMTSIYFLVIWGKKIEISLTTFVIISLFVLSLRDHDTREFRHYEVEVTKKVKRIDRLKIREYISKWILYRENEIVNSKGKYPVVFSGAQGGGSKAALWSSFVNAYIQENASRYFDKHLLLLTGASGGSVGNGVFLLAANNEENNSFFYEKPINGINSKMGQMFRSNFLSSSMASFFGRDWVQSLLGISVSKNRSELLEEDWEEVFGKCFTTETRMDSDFLDFFNDKPYQTKPIFMINTTTVHDGSLSIISSVDFKDEGSFNTIRDFYSDVEGCIGYQPNIHFSTALSLGARYPLLNPSGQIKNCNQYVDAGYYDNFGVISLGKVKSIFQNIIEKDFPHLVNKIEVVELLIINEELKKKPLSIVPQLITPVKTFFSAQENNQFSRLNEIGESPIQINLEVSPIKIGNKDKSVSPVLPLGRYLSNVAVRSIENNLMKETDSKHKLDRLIAVINQN